MGNKIYKKNLGMKKKLLLTGASGTVGLEVLRQLCQLKKYDLTVLGNHSKRSRKNLPGFCNEAKIIYGDIANEKDVEEVCKDIDVVIHLAAVIPPKADEKTELAHLVNTVGTENLVKYLQKHSPNAFLIYSSSIAIYGDRINNPYIKVGDPLTPSVGDEYAKTKIAAEEIIQNSKLDWTILRLTAIMGGHKVSNLMFHMPLNTPMEIATPQDTARAFVNAVEKRDELKGRIFNLSGGESCRISYQDFLDRSFQMFGLGKADFPPKTFAEKNFHCGYYADGDDLEEILHFRRDDLDTYFEREKHKIKFLKKVSATLFRKPVKLYLWLQSEPYWAYKKKDKKLMQRFFYNESD